MAWVAIGTAAAGVATAALSSPSGGGSGAPAAAAQPGVNPSSGSKIFGQINYRTAAEIKNAAQNATSSASADGSFSPNSGTQAAAIPSWVYITAAATVLLLGAAYALKKGKK
ncbi:MAG TPA: hypothetical protein VL357_01660 [Rariglobus sp.]|nr:hypothetical protein [Rariglobus sp.]